MVEDIILDSFPKEFGVYLFKANNEVIYVGSSNNLYMRMTNHRSSIRKGGNDNGTSKQDLYKFLQSNHFVVEFQITGDYRQLEQKLIEQYHPKYNSNNAKGLNIERSKETKRKYRKTDKYKEYNKEYEKSEKRKESKRKYNNQLCNYNNETLTLDALRHRLKRRGIEHPQIEAKKYLI